MVDWYYARDNQRVGPIGESEFRRLAAAGNIGDSTLVWRAGMDAWQPYGAMREAAPVGADPYDSGRPLDDFDPGVALHGAKENCVECGRVFGIEEMVRYGDAYVCAECKPVFFQRIRETGEAPRAFVYGGFWIRFAARVVDGVLMFVVQIAMTAMLVPLFPSTESGAEFLVLQFLSMVLGVTYEVFFLGRFAATPGKMVCGLKVVRSDGTPITYMRAFGRYFAQVLSVVTLMIGYIMAAFDREKRALHDHICDTRVIHT